MFNKSESRVLQPIKTGHRGTGKHQSKGSESKCDTEGDISESRTIEALEILKEEDYTQNWSSFRMCLAFNLFTNFILLASI
jgi:hypothetical protein